MSAREITQTQWSAVLDTSPWTEHPNAVVAGDAPAVCVTSKQAQKFLDKLNNWSKCRFHLPTKSQWLCACCDTVRLNRDSGVVEKVLPKRSEFVM